MDLLLVPTWRLHLVWKLDALLNGKHRGIGIYYTEGIREGTVQVYNEAVQIALSRVMTSVWEGLMIIKVIICQEPPNHSN